MSTATPGLLVGGLVPALGFGLSGAVQKSAAGAGIATGPYLVVIGLVVAGGVPAATSTR